ncbi:MAG: cysteine peptidase family C39 domain-containing protein [Patescibacteria group bacterium]
MLNLNPFRQSGAYCGPASLKILFDYYGENFSEKELGELCNTTFELGTNHLNITEAVKKLGYTPETKEIGTTDDLKKYIQRGIPIVVGWWSTEESHFSVVYGIDDKYIYLMDPELDEGKRTMSLEEWNKVWFDYESPQNKRVDRWMMAVPPV